MANPAVTYTFSNSTTADATQVNQNFTDILNALTDGTKNLNMSAITAGGALTANANVTLGASSSNLIVFNGSINSSIPINTNTTYAIGSSSVGLSAIYLGGGSTFTTKVVSASLSGSYTLALPATAGVTGQFPVTDGSGNLSFRYPDKYVGTGISYSATGSESFISCSGNITITLPAVSSVPYKRYVIKKTDNNLSNIITIARTGSDTFGDQISTSLTSLTLNTVDEAVELINDGTSVWFVVNRKIPSYWVSFTPTGTLSTNCTYTGKYRRIGDSVEVYSNVNINGSSDTATIAVNTPGIGNLTIDTTKLPSTSGNQVVGTVFGEKTGTSSWLGAAVYNSTTSIAIGNGGGNANFLWSNAGGTGIPVAWGNSSSDYITWHYTVPITGWIG